MNCDQARQLIDLRVQDGNEPQTSVCAEYETSIQSARTEVRGSQRDWSELDEHLATCPQCRAELEELRRVRGLLAAAASERPSDVEVQNMWVGIQTALASGEVRSSKFKVQNEPRTSVRADQSGIHDAAQTEVCGSQGISSRARGWWLRNRSLVVSMTGIAAVLVLAFQLGDSRYGRSKFGRGDAYTYVDASLPTASSGDLAIPGSSRQPRTDEGEPRRRAASGAKPRDAMASVGYVRGGSQNAPAAPPAPSAIDIEKSNPFGGNMLIGGNLDGYRQDNKPAAASPSKMVVSADAAPPEEKIDRRALAVPEGVDAGGLAALLAQSQQAASRGNSFEAGDKSEGTPLSPTASPVPQNLKIIKTGEITIEVPAYADSMARVEQIVRERGGFVADGNTHEESGGALVGRMVVRVAPERFEEVFAALKAVGRVLAENVKAADVTAEYVDLDARIKSLQITEERLRELIANKSFVDKIASLLEVEKEMNRVRTEIEQLQGQLRVMADRVGLSTIVLTVREPGRTVPSASLSVEVGTLAESASKMGDMLGKTDGRLVSGKTSKRSDGTLMGTYSIETNLARFAEVVGGIEALGRVEERQVKDQQFSEAGQPWAKNVTCSIALVLFERSRQLPTASVRIEVDKLDTTMKRLSEILDANDATLASNQASRMSDGSNSAEIHLRVPAGRFGGLFDALGSLGRMTSKSVAGESSGIVGGAAAVPCDVTLTLAEKPREVPKGSMAIEVATFDVARQSLSRAIAERQVQVLSSSSNQRDDGTWLGTFRLGVPAKEMEGFVSKLESLGRVAARKITGLGLGDLSRIDPDSLGVIELTLAEKASFTPAPDEASASIRARIRDGLGGFYSSIGLIAYGLTVLLPWLMLAGIGAWLMVRIRRSIRNRKSVISPPT